MIDALLCQELWLKLHIYAIAKQIKINLDSI